MAYPGPIRQPAFKADLFLPATFATPHDNPTSAGLGRVVVLHHLPCCALRWLLLRSTCELILSAHRKGWPVQALSFAGSVSRSGCAEAVQSGLRGPELSGGEVSGQLGRGVCRRCHHVLSGKACFSSCLGHKATV